VVVDVLQRHIGATGNQFQRRPRGTRWRRRRPGGSERDQTGRDDPGGRGPAGFPCLHDDGTPSYTRPASSRNRPVAGTTTGPGSEVDQGSMAVLSQEVTTAEYLTV